MDKEYHVVFKYDIEVFASSKEDAKEKAKVLFEGWLEHMFERDFTATVYQLEEAREEALKLFLDWEEA